MPVSVGDVCCFRDWSYNSNSSGKEWITASRVAGFKVSQSGFWGGMELCSDIMLRLRSHEFCAGSRASLTKWMAKRSVSCNVSLDEGGQVGRNEDQSRRNHFEIHGRHIMHKHLGFQEECFLWTTLSATSCFQQLLLPGNTFCTRCQVQLKRCKDPSVDLHLCQCKLNQIHTDKFEIKYTNLNTHRVSLTLSLK